MDWIYKYNNAFINDISNDDILNLIPIKPTFIEISKDKIIDKIESSIPNTIKLNYKDVSLEFGTNELDKVMEILRRW